MAAGLRYSDGFDAPARAFSWFILTQVSSVSHPLYEIRVSALCCARPSLSAGDAAASMWAASVEVTGA
ncbi:hypothetical protein P3T16_004085 [Paraburkholderia sp. GAS42]